MYYPEEPDTQTVTLQNLSIAPLSVVSFVYSFSFVNDIFSHAMSINNNGSFFSFGK